MDQIIDKQQFIFADRTGGEKGAGNFNRLRCGTFRVAQYRLEKAQRILRKLTWFYVKRGEGQQTPC